jgi:hypothetical protein
MLPRPAVAIQSKASRSVAAGKSGRWKSIRCAFRSVSPSEPGFPGGKGGGYPVICASGEL